MSKVENTIEFIETFIPHFMNKNKIPGVSIAVVHEGEMIYADGFGVRDIAKNLPSTQNTLYGIGSCTKSFVSIAIMQLVEKGKIRLTDPVNQYIPLKIGLPDKPITIHHLLTHTSGIPSLATSTISLHRGIGEEIGIPWGSVNDFYRFINGANDEIVDKPGKRFFYFNAGYRMLGHIIQKVSGMTFDAYINLNIFKPLNMKRTTFSREYYERDFDKITPYLKKPDGSLMPTEFPYPNLVENPDFSFTSAAGGIISSVTDLTRYLNLNMYKGELDGIKLLNPTSVNKIQEIYIDRPPGYFGKHGYGYGWDITEDFLGYKMLFHGGSILVSTAHLSFIPDLKMGVAMASNTSGFPFSTISEGVFAALMGKDPTKVVPALQISKKMDELVGTYEIYKGISRINVVNKSGLLYLEKKDKFENACIPLIPEDDKLESTRFYTLSDGIRQPVEFIIHSHKSIDLYVERYRYHKIIG